MTVRAADQSEVDALARLWFDGWRDAHAGIAPAGLTRARTLESFGARMEAALVDVRVIGSMGAPLGFYILRGGELDHFYVAAEARGKGIATALIEDAELQLAERGFETAWLHCAVGNDRAARFYEKSGWRSAGTFPYQLETAGGSFDIEVWRYEKLIAHHRRAT